MNGVFKTLKSNRPSCIYHVFFLSFLNILNKMHFQSQQKIEGHCYYTYKSASNFLIMKKGTKQSLLNLPINFPG